MLNVFLADLHRLRVGLGVIVPIWKAECTSVGEGDDTLRVFQILVTRDGEKRVGACPVGVAGGDDFRQIGQRVDGRDAFQGRLDRIEARPFHGRLIHAGLEVVSDLLFGVAAAGAAFGCLVEDAP